jgi:hypothetical protein
LPDVKNSPPGFSGHPGSDDKPLQADKYRMTDMRSPANGTTKKEQQCPR